MRLRNFGGTPLHGIRADCGFLIFDSKKVRAKSLGLFFGRGTKARTQKNGFGDRYVTITSCPYWRPAYYNIIASPCQQIIYTILISTSPCLLFTAAHFAVHPFGLHVAQFFVAQFMHLRPRHRKQHCLRQRFREVVNNILAVNNTLRQFRPRCFQA